MKIELSTLLEKVVFLKIKLTRQAVRFMKLVL